MVVGTPEEYRYFVKWSGGAEGYAQGLAFYAAEATRRGDLTLPELAGEIALLFRMPGVEESQTAATLATTYANAVKAVKRVRDNEPLLYVPSLVIEPALPQHEDPDVLEVAKIRQRVIAAHKAAAEAKAASTFLEMYLNGYPLYAWPWESPKNRQKKAS